MYTPSFEIIVIPVDEISLKRSWFVSAFDADRRSSRVTVINHEFGIVTELQPDREFVISVESILFNRWSKDFTRYRASTTFSTAVSFGKKTLGSVLSC